VRHLLSQSVARMSADWREHPDLSSRYDEVARGASVGLLPRDVQTWAVLGFYVAAGYWLRSMQVPLGALWLVAGGVGLGWASLWVERNEASLVATARQHALRRPEGRSYRRYRRLWFGMVALQAGVAAVGLFAGAITAALVL
jgi:hypothetical protein